MIALKEYYRDTIVIEELLVIRYRCLLARHPRRIVFMHIKYRDVVDRWTLKGSYTVTEKLPSSVRVKWVKYSDIRHQIGIA